MIWLIAGLALFLGSHSVQIVAPGWRAGVIARLGDGPWKGLYTLAALAGLILIGYGYGQTRGAEPLYALPPGLRHLTYTLVWLGFVCNTAAYWPGNHIKALLRDPMVAGVGLWALGHLLVRATPGAVALFGAFLVWAIADYISCRLRAPSGKPAVPPRALNTVLVVIVGTVLTGVFAMWLHLLLIGVSPMG